MTAPPLGKDLVGLEDLSADQIRLILDTAEPFKEVSERPIKKVPALRGKTIVNLFFEASTRTRISFEFAEKRLSADTVNVAASGSSVQKGETLVDTARNLEAMRIDMVVIRHPSSGAAEFLGNRIRSNVINAGDGKHEHPTQGLLDLLTIRDKHGRIDGIKVCLVGDVLHSRVARSNIWGLRRPGVMRSLLLKGGRVIDPSRGFDQVADVLIQDGKIAAVGPGLGTPDGAEVRDVRNKVVAPGLVDVHVHLREPGNEDVETIASGARAAAAGGFTTVCAMPNTDPVTDNQAAVGFIVRQSVRAGLTRVYPIGAISVGQRGERLSEFGEMVGAGAVAVSDDGKPVVSSHR